MKPSIADLRFNQL